MKTLYQKIQKIKVAKMFEIPDNFTGEIFNDTNKSTYYYKKGRLHREDGPSVIDIEEYKEWFLDGKYIWNSKMKFNLTNKIVLSKTKHSEYPKVQVWKILGSDGLYERFIIPGMEKFIIE